MSSHKEVVVVSIQKAQIFSSVTSVELCSIRYAHCGWCSFWSRSVLAGDLRWKNEMRFVNLE